VIRGNEKAFPGLNFHNPTQNYSPQNIIDILLCIAWKISVCSY